MFFFEDGVGVHIPLKVVLNCNSYYFGTVHHFYGLVIDSDRFEIGFISTKTNSHFVCFFAPGLGTGTGKE